jgi:CO/xanthine dehydrogenase Mo-binding subunit
VVTTTTEIGRSLRRLEGGDKAAGITRFTADLQLVGLLDASLVLSHLPSARIRSIDSTAARAVPGVVDVVTGADLGRLSVAGPEQPLAVDRVFYAGQPVAAVVGESESAAWDGAAHVQVDYEALPAVIDAELAMREDAPLVLDSGEAVNDDEASIHGGSTGSEDSHAPRPRNVTAISDLKRGDPDAALAAADVVVRATYRMAGVHQGFIEPHVSIARPEPDGGITIWAPTQGPFFVRDHLAQVLGLPAHKIRVIPMPVGGGFGGKLVLLEPLVAMLAIRTGRAVRLQLTRQQEFVLGRAAPAAKFDLQLGAQRDGTLVALRVHYTYDNGATGGWHTAFTTPFLGGTYRLPNFEIRGYEVATNKTPVGAYRGPGATQAYFALESALDELAQNLAMDPVELRLRNASREGDMTADGQVWPRTAVVECLEEVRLHPLYSAPLAAGEGVGIALGSWGGANTPAAVGCRVEPDGSLTIIMGMVDISGSGTGLAMIAAEAFGVSTDMVRIEVPDTNSAPYGPTASGSQAIYSMGGAVQEAALEARRQLFDIAKDELEAAPEDLEIIDGRVTVRGVPDRFVHITQLVAQSNQVGGRYRPIQSTGRAAVESTSPMFTVQIARVTTDPETGDFRLIGYAAIQDVGRAINPGEIEGQIHGGAAQALGRALGEQLLYDGEGQLRTASFLDYELPSSDQLPDIDVRILEVRSPIGPLGVKGVGEPPAIPGPAALANAVSRATGVRIREVPIDRILLVRPAKAAL